ncbi:aldo/keto reductase [Micromonospora sp. DH14]|uniref:aldo/keto reductase n=1 Tax=Micromonospora sp. DH14 TaxID=3040120 RepID=UPI002443189F|nr:aldo/keto reductase [Micromonospora sp. DH14]MDG9675971.1 aldo/keto reductase [Micromonospora sp. DH14]
MQYRPLGRTGLNVSMLGYGASPLGGVFGEIDEREGTRAVRTALDLGVNIIDVSPYYGATVAETVLGRALRGVDRESYVLASKVGRYGESTFDFSATRVTASVEESLTRLGTDHLDLIQCHDIEFGDLDQIIDETLPALAELRAAGKVRFLGITGYPLAALTRVAATVPVDTVLSYCRYTLLDRALAAVVPDLAASGTAVMNASPLAMGLLSRRGAPAWHPASPAVRQAAAAAAELCARHGVDIAQVALRFAAAPMEFATTFVGSASADNMARNVRWALSETDPELLQDIEKLLAPVLNHSWPSGRPENNTPAAGVAGRPLAGASAGTPATDLAPERGGGVNRSAHYVGSETFVVEETDDVPPGPGQVRVRVAYTGICGTDLHIAHGAMDQRVRVPAVIGHEMSGRVVEVGTDVDGHRVGDPVTVLPLDWCGECPACRAGHTHICHRLNFIGIDSPGSMQRYWTVPARVLVPLPEDLPLAHGALVEPTAVAVHDVRRSRLVAGEHAVVIGAGPVGLLIGVVARAAGAMVTVLELDPRRRALAVELGMSAVDPAAVDATQYVQEVTGGAGADVVFEVSGSASGVRTATDLLAVRGRLVVVAIHPQPREVDLHRIFWRELEVIGVRVYQHEDYAEAVRLVHGGQVPADRLISRIVPLDEVAQAFQALAAGGDVKVLIDCGGDA